MHPALREKKKRRQTINLSCSEQMMDRPTRRSDSDSCRDVGFFRSLAKNSRKNWQPRLYLVMPIKASAGFSRSLIRSNSRAAKVIIRNWTRRWRQHRHVTFSRCLICDGLREYRKRDFFGRHRRFGNLLIVARSSSS